jgi:hypothetical protein
MRELYRERYRDFTVKHFDEQPMRRHNYKLCYSVMRLSLQAAGIVAKVKTGHAPQETMLLFQDARSCCWIAAGEHDSISSSRARQNADRGSRA